jgi:hypothetical protein
VEPESLSSSREGLNPIESTIGTNRTGWASFFSSKALIVKRVSGEDALQKENTMEVMDLDEEEEQRPVLGKINEKNKAGQQSTAIPVEHGKGKDQRKISTDLRVQLHSPRLKDTPPAPPATKPDSSPSKPSMPVLSVSDSVKNEAVKPSPTKHKRKSVSPTPSKKSGTVTPAHTPSPNLVLPTWTDTFHTAPRNIVPQPPASNFTKTMKFVSGVLFARDDKGKGKEQDFSQFGKELPRAWDVVGNKLDSDVLKGCKNVVVIGIHGWFPGASYHSAVNYMITHWFCGRSWAFRCCNENRSRRGVSGFYFALL